MMNAWRTMGTGCRMLGVAAAGVAAAAAVAAGAVAAAGSLEAEGVAQSRGRSAWCDDFGSSDRPSYCEVREATVPGFNPLDIDASPNGGIRISGWDRSDVLVRSRIAGQAETNTDARRLVSGVQIVISGGSVRAEGPLTTSDHEHWSVSFEAQVPRAAMVTLNTRNGGISINDFRGTAKFRTQNGGVTLNDVGGDIHGGTTNGGVTVDLTGDRWDGTGLDVETRNGGIRIAMPENYSAELEAGTTNGGVRLDFPVTVSGTIGGRHFTTVLGAGGARIRAVTTNGGVVIRRK